MAVRVIDSRRKYQRIRLTNDEKNQVEEAGLVPVYSSNVSAIARIKNTLVVRFHGGSMYAYPKSGNLFNRMLNSSSKGKFVWNELRRKNVPYKRIGSLPMDYDRNINRDIMQMRELDAIKQELAGIKTVVKARPPRSIEAVRTQKPYVVTPPNIPIEAITMVTPKIDPMLLALGTVLGAGQLSKVITTLVVVDSIKVRTLTAE